MLRILPRLLLVLFPISAVAQTADDLTARYGYPDAERFLARPEIVLTAKYAKDHAACEMLIGGRGSEQQSMATVAVSEIIDELIPRWQRGILLDHSIESMGAAEHQVFKYQNVTISRTFMHYLPATVVYRTLKSRELQLSGLRIPHAVTAYSDLGIPKLPTVAKSPFHQLQAWTGVLSDACFRELERRCRGAYWGRC